MIEKILFLTKTGKCLFFKNYLSNKVELTRLVSLLIKEVSNNPDTNIIYDICLNDNDNNTIIYRCLNNIYVILLCSQLENELAMIDFINMYTSTIDEFLIGFEELTLLLNIEKINIITNEIITAGIVVDLNKTEVLKYCKEIISK